MEEHSLQRSSQQHGSFLREPTDSKCTYWVALDGEEELCSKPKVFGILLTLTFICFLLGGSLENQIIQANLFWRPVVMLRLRGTTVLPFCKYQVSGFHR